MATVNIYNMADTWNNVATTFTAIKMNVTDTASASGSLLMDLQVGGNSVLSLRKDSRLLVGSAGSIGGGIVMESANRLGILAGTSQVVSVRSGGIVQPSTGTLSWTSGVVGGTEDLVLLRDAANTLAQRNGTNAQTLRLYNTYTDASNYERGNVGWVGSVFTVTTSQAGTGTGRQVGFGVNGNVQWVVNTGGHYTPAGNNASDLGSASLQVRDSYFARDLFRPGGTQAIFRTSAGITSGAGAGAGTLTNAPAAGNPTCWIPINDNGTTRYIPAW